MSYIHGQRLRDFSPGTLQIFIDHYSVFFFKFTVGLQCFVQKVLGRIARMRPICSVVCMSARALVSCAKMAEPIKMLLGGG